MVKAMMLSKGLRLYRVQLVGISQGESPCAANLFCSAVEGGVKSKYSGSSRWKKEEDDTCDVTKEQLL